MAISSLSLPHFKCKWNSVVTHTTGSVCTGFSSSPQAPSSSSSLFLKRYIYPLILLYTSYSGRTCDDVTIFFFKADLFEEGRMFFQQNIFWCLQLRHCTVSISLYVCYSSIYLTILIFWNILDKCFYIKNKCTMKLQWFQSSIQIFWEGHKNMTKSPKTSWCC